MFACSQLHSTRTSQTYRNMERGRRINMCRESADMARLYLHTYWRKPSAQKQQSQSSTWVLGANQGVSYAVIPHGGHLAVRHEVGEIANTQSLRSRNALIRTRIERRTARVPSRRLRTHSLLQVLVQETLARRK